MTDVSAWLETAGPFEADTEGGVWRAAYETYSGLAVGGYDLGFMFEVERCGYSSVPLPGGGYRLAKVA